MEGLGNRRRPWIIGRHGEAEMRLTSETQVTGGGRQPGGRSEPLTALDSARP